MMVLGIIAGIIGIIGYIPYVRDILKGSTRPDRASWFIWLLEYTALFIAQVKAGGEGTLWIIGSQLFGVICICALSSKYGVGGFDRHSRILLFIVCIVLAIWYFSNSAGTAILLLLAVEISGVLLTVRKVYRQPGSETLIMWILMAVAGILGVAAVGMSEAFILYIYPAALIVMGLGVVAASWAGTKRTPALIPAHERELIRRIGSSY